MVEKGFPKKISKLAVDLHDHQYWDVQADLMLANVGQTLGHYETHEATIQLLNSAQQGETRTLRRARQVVYWPKMTSDVKNVIRCCAACATLHPSQ